MKTTKILQWVGFAVLLVGGLFAGAIGIGLLFAAVGLSLVGVAGLYALIACMAFGALWGYACVMVWIWLAELGWFV